MWSDCSVLDTVRISARPGTVHSWRYLWTSERTWIYSWRMLSEQCGKGMLRVIFASPPNSLTVHVRLGWCNQWLWFIVLTPPCPQYNVDRERRPVVFVVSTTGDGDPPDTAQKFVRKIKNRSLQQDSFSHLCYALLGKMVTVTVMQAKRISYVRAPPLSRQQFTMFLFMQL